MLFLVFYLFGLIAALGAGAVAGWSDFKGMTIANRLSLVVLAAFVVAWPAAYYAEAGAFQPVKMHILSGLIMFAVTFVLFLMRVIGGGDSKLLSVYALWTGVKGMAGLIFYVALFGGVLALAALAISRFRPFGAAPEGSWIARVQAGESAVPYGIAITFGAVMAFVDLGYFSPDTLSQFLLLK